MSDATNNLALPYIMAAQAQKHVTHNEAITALDSLVHLAVVSRTLDAPLVSPEEGQRFIAPAMSTGDWAQNPGEIAAYQDGGWIYHAPREGWRAWVEDEQRMVIFSAGSWMDLIVQPPEPEPEPEYGSRSDLRTVEDEVSLSGASVLANIHIPNRAIVLAVSVKVVTTISGATSFEVGTETEPSKFGGLLGINLGDTNTGVIGPTAFYADTPLQITAIGGYFQAGSIHLALHTIECSPPQS